MALLEVTDLKTHFFTGEGVVKAVDGVSFSIDRGEVLGIVGESGSGKSVTSLSLLGIVPDPPGKIVGGKILLEGEDLVTMKPNKLRSLRGNRIAMIFQDPMTSLNPYLTVGEQLAEVLELHRSMRRSEAKAKSIEMLKAVGIPAAEQRFDDHPHHMSGGMRQRVMIAMALLCDPVVLVADEPTTALDVTIQAQILDLLDRGRQERALLLITHDLGVVAKMADRVAVMYAGRIVEAGPAERIFASPKHPYTIGLARSVPRLDGDASLDLVPIPGMPPSLAKLPKGCPFAARCTFVIDKCRETYPAARTIAGEGKSLHVVHCHVESVSLDKAPTLEEEQALERASNTPGAV